MRRKTLVMLAMAGLGISSATPSAAQAPPVAEPPMPPPTGRYGSVMEYDPGTTPEQTIYRPRDLGAAKLPIIAWGNGGCMDDGGAGARPFLMQLASEGYLVIAPAKPGPDPRPEPVASQPPAAAAQPAAAPQGPPPGAATGAPPPTTTANLIAAIDWAVRENGRQDSIYFNRIDTSKVAVSGHSCGGLQALEAAADPRVTTALIWNSGVLPFDLRGSTMTKAKLAKLHAPVLLVQGGPSDVAYQPALETFAAVQGVPIFLGELPVGHGGTFRVANGGDYAKVGRAWLDWRLKGVTAAGATFSGANCGLCTDPKWKVQRKGMD